MDATRFDRFAKSLSSVGTRSGLLRLLSGLPLAALLRETAGAARRRRHGDDPRHDDYDGNKKRKGKGKKPFCQGKADGAACGAGVSHAFCCQDGVCPTASGCRTGDTPCFGMGC